MTLRINMWSSPRNLSTALMYSWRQRSDTTVVDEPLYAHYLSNTGRSHPGGIEVIASQDTDGEAVVRDVLLGEYPTEIVFFKQMAKHLLDLDRGFLASGPNILLTREPADMLNSLQVQLPDLTMADTGFDELVSILETTVAEGGQPIVVETSSLLANPEGILRALCAAIGIEFQAAMMSWPQGPKPEDGVWARHWYDRVWASTGWAPQHPKHGELSAAAKALLPACQKAYDQLATYQITAH